MSKIMFQFRYKGEKPSLEQVRHKFNLHPEEVDVKYGVVQTDAVKSLYLILVNKSAQEKIKKKLKSINANNDPMVGLFSNPHIEPNNLSSPHSKNKI